MCIVLGQSPQFSSKETVMTLSSEVPDPGLISLEELLKRELPLTRVRNRLSPKEIWAITQVHPMDANRIPIQVPREIEEADKIFWASPESRGTSLS